MIAYPPPTYWVEALKGEALKGKVSRAGLSPRNRVAEASSGDGANPSPPVLRTLRWWPRSVPLNR